LEVELEVEVEREGRDFFTGAGMGARVGVWVWVCSPTSRSTPPLTPAALLDAVKLFSLFRDSISYKRYFSFLLSLIIQKNSEE
jgi:hypothetical protein